MRAHWPLTARGTGALVLALACFVVAGELGVGELVYFGVLLVAALAGSLLSLYLTHRTESVDRRLEPSVVPVEARADVRVRVGVRSALPSAPGRWSDSLPRGLAGRAEGVFPAVGSGLRAGDRAVELHYSVTGVRRGIHSIGPLSVTSTDPFGLTRRRNLLGDRTSVVVVPAIVELPPLSTYAGDQGGSRHAATDQLGEGADNLIARPYSPGDSMRRIHWRATAHSDTLMVRQEEQESSPEATVVLDLGALRWATEARQAPGTDPGFERAVSACASVTARLVLDGYAVRVIDAEGHELTTPLDGGEWAQIETLTRELATLTTRRDDHLRELPRLFAGAVHGPVVLIAGRLDPEDAASLTPLAAHSALPILLAVSPIDESIAVASAGGWRAASIALSDDLTVSWGAVAERGVNRVFG